MTADFTITNHGNICLLTPNTNDAQTWAANHLPDDALTFGGGIAIEPRYVDAIVDGFQSEGLTCE